MKKVLSVVLALIMLLSCFSMMSFAAVNDAVLKIEIKPTSTDYQKGDVVTFEAVYESTSDLGMMGAAFTFSVGYDSSVFEPIETFTNAPVNFPDQTTVVYTGYPVENNISPAVSTVRKYAAEKLNANDTAKGWNEMLIFAFVPTGSCDDDYSTPKASFAFKLKVKDDANAAGCYSVGVTDYSIQNNETEIDEEVGSIFGPSGIDFGFSVNNIFETVDGTVVMGGAAVATPKVAKSAAELKFTATKSDSTGVYDGVEDDYSFRVTSTITDADWDTYFANTGVADATTDCITAVGVVAYKGTDGFNAETAKGVVAGTAATGYAAASTDYIQKTPMATGDAKFGAIILLNANTDTDVTYMGYVQYLDNTGAAQTIFYDASAQALLATNYATYTASYLAMLNA